jgi:RNA polymerase sigma-70 factor, ECF subfamily
MELNDNLSVEDRLFVDFKYNGNDDSFRKLFKMVKPWLYKVIFRITGDKDIADDVLQETWIAVINNYQPGKGKINNYIYTIAKNLAININKQGQIFVREKENDDEFKVTDTIVNETPLDIYEKNELNNMLMLAINKLALEYQDVIIMHHFAELDVKEVAKKLGVPEGTIKARLSRGREKLKQILLKNKKFSDIAQYSMAIFIIFYLFRLFNWR